jgi:hemolysin activation/secretion protein
VLRLGWSRRAPIFKTWRLNLNADLQLASGPLASPEQFGAGGAESVRGYFDYEQVGDQGWALRADLNTPPWVLGSGQLTGLVFFDRAGLRTFNAQAGQLPTAQMGSAGLGLRGEHASGLQVAMDLASPIFATYKTNDANELERTHAPRFSVSVKQPF